MRIHRVIRLVFLLSVAMQTVAGVARAQGAATPRASGTALANVPPTLEALRAGFASRLEEIAASLDGTMGYVVWDLTSGDRLERLPGAEFPTASTIKLGILYELFKQAEEGRVKLDVPEPLTDAARVGGSGILFELSKPSLSLRDYAVLMVVLSDNSATNLLIDRLGMDRINERMRALGVGDARLRRRMIDLEAARRGDENVATPAAIAKLLDILRRGEGLTEQSRDAALAILSKTKSTSMTSTLPSGVRIASKPGDLDGVRVDAGIVFLDRRPYIFVAMCAWLNQDADGERAIGQASRAAFDYFSRVAAGGRYGRFIDRQ